MESWMIILGICGLYLVITLVMGILPGLKVSHSTTGYVAGDRSMNVFILYFVLGASIFSSFAFLGGPGWAYSRGVAALYIIAYGAVGMVPFYFLDQKHELLVRSMALLLKPNFLKTDTILNGFPGFWLF